MGEKKVPVRSYKRSDGTAVSGHNRSIQQNKKDVKFSLEKKTSLKDDLSGLNEPGSYCRLLGKNIPYRDSGAIMNPLNFNEKNVLHGVNFSNLDLRGANFSGMKLENVNFTGADLRFANFDNSELYSVNFTGAILTGATLEGAILHETEADVLDLAEVNMANAMMNFKFLDNFKKCVVYNLDKSVMPAMLSGVDMSGQDLTNVNFQNCSFRHLSMANCNLRGVNLDTSDFLFCNLADSDLSGASVTSSKWVHVSGPRANFEDTNFCRSELTFGGFVGANFSGSLFGGAHLKEVDFREVNFSKADFHAPRKTVIRKCDFGKANFSEADVRGVNFADRPSDVFPEEDYHLWSDGPCEGSNLMGVNWRGTLIEDMVVANFKYLHFYGENEDDGYDDEVWTEALHEKYTMKEAMKELKLQEKQFEFMVLSGVIEVRSDIDGKIVTSGFDPEDHYVPVWVVQNAKFD